MLRFLNNNVINKKNITSIIGGTLFFIVIVMPSIVSAQALKPLKQDGQGRITIQGGVLEAEEEEIAPLVELIDYREHMREFIQNISKFGHSLKPGFIIMVEDAQELLTISNLVEENEIVIPARSYIRAIDGVLETGLFYGVPAFGKPHDEPAIQEVRIDYAKRAKSESLKVFVLDMADQKNEIDMGHQLSRHAGYIYASIPTARIPDATLPEYPDRPFEENSESVISLKSVKNYAVIGNSTVYGREDEFALKMHETNYDLIIADVFHGLKPLSRKAVRTLQYKKTGSKRLVLARVNIGTASRHHYYWGENWGTRSPSWVGPPMQKDPDRHFVEFWKPQWQNIITGNADSFIQGVIAQGFDGVVLADVDVYENYDGGSDSQTE